MAKYDHTKVEEKWQKRWEESGIYSPNIEEAKKKFYNLWMFPYPSGEGLHAGHAFASTGSDVYGRYQRMQGNSVFQPIGYDSFGIHSENFAIKTGEHPTKMLERTTANYEKQLRSLGLGFDWSRTVTTSDVDYYRWTQWIFTQMFKAGLAYRKKASVNWCPSCKTVLADEQVVTPKQAGKEPKNIDGSPINDSENAQVCERCGTVVEKKDLAQWFFRITEYADRLLENLDKIDWSDRVVTAQRNWIGKSKGLNIDFKIENFEKKITVWTKFWETVFGTTFLVISPEHPIIRELKIPESIKSAVSKYVQNASKLTLEERTESKDKTGVFTGLYAVNQVNGDKIPIWVADYVLMEVGTGAVMGVPAHDERDFEFAKKYNLEIKPVIIPEREYVDENAKNYYRKRTQLHKELLKKLVGTANKYKKRICLMGGWAASVQVGKEYRDFEDIDLVILKDDVAWWKDTFATFNLKIKNMFEGYNEKYYFQAVKKDIHIDIVAIDINKSGNVVWLSHKSPKESDKFESIFEKREFEGMPVYATSKDVLYYEKQKHTGVRRWKESADFLYMGYECYEGEGKLVDSEKFDGLNSRGVGKEKMAVWMVDNKIANWETNYHLRDWLISRQRYWGPPIPMIYCEKCAKSGTSWFDLQGPSLQIRTKDQVDWSAAGWWPEEDLPVELPLLDNYKPKGNGRGPLGDHPEFYEVKCPNCGGDAKRETDVSDTFLDSAWYFLRYPSVNLEQEVSKQETRNKNQVTNKSQAPNPNSKIENLPWDPTITKAWLPVDLYFGGAEHSVLHLMYARFVTMVMHDLGHTEFEEPFPKFYAHGLMIKDGAKMSKSRGNVVNPDEYIEKFGADTLRLYLMFMGPMDGYPDFRDTGIEGMRRFIQKVWGLFVSYKLQMTSDKQSPSSKLQTKKQNGKWQMEDDRSTEVVMHQTIQKVTKDIERYHYNTAIAALMEYVNALQAQVTSNKLQVTNNSQKLNSKSQNPNYQLPTTNYLTTLALLIAPFAPHMAEEAWELLTKNEEPKTKSYSSIHTEPWPKFDPKLIATDTVTIPVQVNGKLRSQITVDSAGAMDKELVISIAKEDQKVSNWLEGKKIVKEIFIPGKLVNFVV